MKYTELSNQEELNQEAMFEVKGGYVCSAYGCDSNVCAIDRSGAKDLCSTAYCRSGVGPKSTQTTIQKQQCKLFT